MFATIASNHKVRGLKIGDILLYSREIELVCWPPSRRPPWHLGRTVYRQYDQRSPLVRR